MNDKEMNCMKKVCRLLLTVSILIGISSIWKVYSGHTVWAEQAVEQVTEPPAAEVTAPPMVQITEPIKEQVTEQVPEQPSEQPLNQAKTYKDLWDDANEAYLIATVEDLKVFRDSLTEKINYEGKTIYLVNDIVLQENDDFGSVGTINESKAAAFQGKFYGRGHSIEGWSSDDEALFLSIGEQGVVKNLTMKDVQISNAALGVVIAFQNNGTISQCSVSGNISGDGNTYASFCNSNNGTINDCISSVDISTESTRKVQNAGIVSDNKGTVSNCVYCGRLTATQSSNKVLYGITKKNVTNSYFLEQTNYKKSSTACSEEAMKLKSTYEGFDFEHIWTINEEENDGFPVLRTDFPELSKIVKVPVKILVSVGDYIYNASSAPKNCFFPLTSQIVYDGKKDEVKDGFSKLLANYHVTARLRETEWKSDFMVDVPVNGVSQDFSSREPGNYFELSYDANESYEFDVTGYCYSCAAGTYYDSTEGLRSLTTVQKQEILRKADAAARSILDAIVQKYGSDAMDNTWFDFTCARANYYPALTGKDEMFQRLSKVWSEYKTYQTSQGALPETTETSKFVLAITALGFDATDVAGDNLITELIHSDLNGKYFAPHYLAYAIYSGRYGDYLSYARSLIDKEITQSKAGRYSADDMETMYIQPLFLMYGKNAFGGDKKYAEVKEYVEQEVLPWLQRSITGFGSFYSTYTHCSVNVWTDAQAQMLLGLLGEDFLSESYIKNGNSILQYIIANPMKSLEYQGDESQCARAIVSLLRSNRGQANLFDCTDVTGVREIEALIQALPLKITEDDEDKVKQVQAAFQSLTAGQQKQVDNKDILERARKSLDQITVDIGVAKEMENQIAKIGTVTLEKEADIIKLRNEYNQLTQAQKNRISNYQILLDAEHRLQTLKKEQEAKKRAKKKHTSGEASKKSSKKGSNKNTNKKNADNAENAENAENSENSENSDKKSPDRKQMTQTSETGGNLYTGAEHGNSHNLITSRSKKHSSESSDSFYEQNESTNAISKQKARRNRNADKKAMKRSDQVEKEGKKVSVPDLGRSSLILNQHLPDSGNAGRSMELWLMSGISGAGILLLAIGLRMNVNPEKVKEGEKQDETKNIQ